MNTKARLLLKKKVEENSKYDNDKAIYLFNLNKKYDLDGDFRYNTARLINHSCNPNCEVSGVGLKIWVYAIRDIKKERNYPMIMDLDMMNITKIFLADVDQKIVLGI